MKLGTNPIRLNILLIIIWLPVNFWASLNKTVSLFAIGYLGIGILVFVTCTSAPFIRRNPQFVAWLLIGCGTLLATVGLPFVRWKAEFRLFDSSFYRIIPDLSSFSTETLHANLLAGVLLVVLPVLLALFFTSSPGVSGKWYIGCGALVVLCLVVHVLTQSRSGYLGAIAGMGTFFIMRWPRLLWSSPILILGVVLSARRSLFWGIGNPAFWGDPLDGWEVRLDGWYQSANALHDFAITGIGIGSFVDVMAILYPLKVPIEDYPHAHNLFLQVGLDLGLPGLIAYLSILLSCVYMLIQLARDRSDPLRWSLSIGATGSLVGLLVHGIFDAVLWGTKVAFVSWLLFALITLLHMQLVEEASGCEEK